MKISKKRVLLAVVLAFVLTFSLAGTALAKSLYLTTHHSANFRAYNINPPNGDITYQGTYALSYARTPAGVAVHNPTGTLFISEESSDIEIVDGNLNSVGRVNVGTQFAGLAVDDDASVLYAMNRGGNRLYAWDFTAPSTLTLKSGFPKTLSGIASQSGMGIVLDYRSDPKVLWVADGYTNMLRAYDTTTWNQVDSIATPSGHRAVGMGMDTRNRIIYYGSWRYGAWGPGNGTNNCYSIDLNVSPYSVVAHNVGAQVADISVDDDTGLVYLSRLGGASVYDPTTTPWTLVDSVSIINSMAGICVAGISYMPDLKIAKADDVADGACVGVGGTVTYTISYDNTGDTDLTGVTIVDDLPSEVSFGSATGGGTYNSGTHQVTWSIGSVAEGVSGSVTLTAQVKSSAAPGSTIINYATIDSNETNPTTVQENTDICTNQPPVADAGDDQPTVEQEYHQGADVTLDGSGSSDPDPEDTLTYAWIWSGGSDTGVGPTVSLPLGTTTVTLVVNDGTVDSAPDTVDITVVDTTDPVLAIPSDVEVEQATLDGTVVPLKATATDICDADVDITSDELPIYPLGKTTVTFTATDDSLNSTTASMTVTVVDTTDPVLTVPEDVVVEQATLDGTVVPLKATATDICDADVEITSDELTIYPLGTTTVTFTATDDSDNSTTGSMTVTVVDTAAPVFDTLTCVESVNPHGNNVPGKNRGKNGKEKNNVNPDGFYELSFEVSDICDAEPQVWIGTEDDPFLFNITGYAEGVVIKFTESVDAEPEMKKIGSPPKGGATAVTWHIILPCDPVISVVDFSGNFFSCTTCLVPPPPM